MSNTPKTPPRTLPNTHLQAGCARRRTELEAALLRAGEQGASTLALAKATGMSDFTARHNLARMHDVAVLAGTAELVARRWFHVQHADAAQVYMAQQQQKAQQPRGVPKATADRVLRAIVATGRHGITRAELMAATQLANGTLGYIIPRLVHQHGVVVVMRGSTRGHNRHRYLGPGLALDPALAPSPAPSLRRPAKPAPGTLQHDGHHGPADWSRARITRAPAPVDARFAVPAHQVAPVFAALRPGQYLDDDTTSPVAQAVAAQLNQRAAASAVTPGTWG